MKIDQLLRQVSRINTGHTEDDSIEVIVFVGARCFTMRLDEGDTVDDACALFLKMIAEEVPWPANWGERPVFPALPDKAPNSWRELARR